MLAGRGSATEWSRDRDGGSPEARALWDFEDEELDPSRGLSTLLEPVAIGNTVLRVERGSLADELALEVTGVPAPVGDGAAEQ